MKFFPVRVSGVRAEESLPFDIYLQISGKHLCYVKSPDPLDLARKRHLLEKGVREVFISESEAESYREFQAAVEAQARSPRTPSAQKAEIVLSAAKQSVEELFEDPDSKEKYEAVQRAAALQVSVILRNPEALEPMLKLAAYDKSTYQHSVNVATLAIGVAAALGASQGACEALGIGGLLHDIGKTTAEYLSGAQNDAERERAHPRLGASLLVGKSYVSRDVLDVILMHEERLDGKGFPAGIKKIDHLHQIVGATNYYDRLVTMRGEDPISSIVSLCAMSPLPFDKRILSALRGLLETTGVIPKGTKAA